MIDGTKQKIAVNSTPSGAKVTITDETGKTVVETNTPAVVRLKRSRSFFTPAEYAVRLESAGHPAAHVDLEPGVNWWIIGSGALAGIMGLMIDAGTGAMYKFEPTEINAQLAPTNAPTASLQ